MRLDELDALLLTLARSQLRFVVIGGIAVGVHGYIRGTKARRSACARSPISG